MNIILVIEKLALSRIIISSFKYSSIYKLLKFIRLQLNKFMKMYKKKHRIIRKVLYTTKYLVWLVTIILSKTSFRNYIFRMIW